MDSVKIKIIGIGGAGNNTVQFLASQNISNVNFAVINTDIKTLQNTTIEEKLLIGHSITRGLSAGGDPNLGLKALQSDKEKVEALLDGVELVFLICGLGGGTGSGATPVIAEWAKAQGALVITFAMLPFNIEGSRRYQVAEAALSHLRKTSNATICLPNDLLLQNLPPEATVLDSFNLSNTWIYKGIKSIADILHKRGIINIDFNNLKNAFSNAGGKTLYGLSRAQGENYIQRALAELTICPLLHIPQSSQTADTLLVNIIAGSNFTLHDVNNVGSFISQKFKSKNLTVIGAIIDQDQTNSIEITVIGATDATRGAGRKTTSASNAYQQVLFDVLPTNPSENKRSKKQHEEEPLSNRGYFIETSRSLIQGQDVDIPTYLRRGIKIRL